MREILGAELERLAERVVSDNRQHKTAYIGVKALRDQGIRTCPGCGKRLPIDRRKKKRDRARYRAKKSQRLAAWGERKAIEEFYRNCPKGHEVDHIIPLHGRRVSGLHVLANLQYLTKAANRKKRNIYDCST